MEFSWISYYLNVFLEALLRGAPWVVATLGVALVVCFSPLGRAIAAALRERANASALTNDLADELMAVQQNLAELIERLDTTDRQLRQLRSLPESPQAGLRRVTPV